MKHTLPPLAASAALAVWSCLAPTTPATRPAPAGFPCTPPVTFCDQALPPELLTLSCFKGRSSRADAPPMDLAPLACAPQLEALYLVDGELEFILPLALDDLGPLAHLTRLKVLRLDHTTATDLRPLAGLVALEDLSLHATPAKSVKPLKTLKNIKTLDLSGSAVEDLTPLAGLDQLESLALTHAPVTDLTPLLGLPRLRWLGIAPESPANPAGLEALRAARPELKITVGRRY